MINDCHTNRSKDEWLCEQVVEAAMQWFQAKLPHEEVKARAEALEAVRRLYEHRL